MAITTAHCHVLQGTVTRVTDLEGEVTRIICPEYDDRTGLCRLKQRALDGGPLSQFLERVSEDTLATATASCDLAH
jgi:hypothetical protein